MTANARMTLTVAVACVLTSVGLYPLFKGTTWFYAGAGAVITVAACGALSRLRTLPVLVCLAIGGAGLLLYLNLLFEAHHSWVIIPTPDSIRQLWALAGTGFSETRQVAPPVAEVPQLRGLVLLAAGGIGIAALVADLIAVRLRSAALAGLPLLVLFTVPITMNAQHEGVGTTVVFCLGAAGYLAMLSADGRDRIRVWGRLVSLWRSGSMTGTATRPAPARQVAGREAGPDTRALAAAGRRVGLASVVLALFVPLIVPGLHASKLFSSGPGIGGSGGSSSGGAVALPDALQQTLRQLQKSRPTEVLRYVTSAPAQLMKNDPPYLQTYVYDNLTDSGLWTGDYTAGQRQASALPQAAGLTNPAAFPQFSIAVNVADDALTSRSQPVFLTLPYPATHVATPPGDWRADPELMVFSPSSVSVGAYQATFAEVEPTAAELNRAVPPPSGLAADLALPASFKTPALRQIATAETAGFSTEYGKVNALAAWLSSSAFSYSAAAPPVQGAASLLSFLTKTHSGVCVQSAYAMTVLTRLLGYPARLASGYTEGTRSGNSYVVTTEDSHAWAEVYFSGYGWIKFEATPGGGDGTARSSSYQNLAAATGHGLPPGVNTVGPTPGTAQGTARSGSGLRKIIPDEGGSGAGQQAGSAGTPWTAVALAVAAAIALACGVIAIVAPPAQRALEGRPGDGARRRRPPGLPAAALVAAVAAIVALALYRLLSHTSGLDLGVGWATVGVAFGVAGAVVFVVPGVSRIARRRWRWLRARDDAGRAHAAWREFLDDLQDLGVHYSPSEPPRSLADRVGAGLPEPAREAVRRLALAEERACYAARPSGSQNLMRDGAAARRGIEASAGPGRRWRARIFPASAVTALADWAASIPDRLAALLPRRWTERRSQS